MKFKLIFFIIIILAAAIALSACNAPPPHETKIIFHPLGDIGLGMTLTQIERRIGTSEHGMQMEGAYLVDYENLDVDLVISYEQRDNTAFSIRAFGPGRLFNGITVGMLFEDALDLAGEYVVEEFDGDMGMIVFTMLYNSRNQPILVSFDEEGYALPLPDEVSYRASFGVSYDGYVIHLELQYE